MDPWSAIQKVILPVMNDEELHRHCWHNVSFLDQAKVVVAVVVLRDVLLKDGAMEELKARIEANRKGWLMGRQGEMPLHHGWGTNIRNLLREKGCDERFFGIGNLDDYYMPLCEMAAGYGDPYTS